MNPPIIVEADQEASPDAGLITHWVIGDAVRRIKRSHYDVVVLDGSPVWLDTEKFFEYAPKFIELIKQMEGQPILLQDQSDANYQYATAEAVAEANQKVAIEFDLETIPLGFAFERVKQQRPDIRLYDSDDTHPTVAGSYLGVCITYAVVFDKSPVGASYLPLPEGSLSAEDAAFLQQIAWETVQEYKGQ